MKCLKTLEIDTEKRIYRVNGTDISSVHFFSLEFRDGYWSLKIAENDHFSEYHNKLVELMDADALVQMSKDIQKNDVPGETDVKSNECIIRGHKCGRMMVEKWVIDVITNLRLLGVTQKELAKMCGYSEAYVCQVLRGKKDTKQA